MSLDFSLAEKTILIGCSHSKPPAKRSSSAVAFNLYFVLGGSCQSGAPVPTVRTHCLGFVILFALSDLGFLLPGLGFCVEREREMSTIFSCRHGDLDVKKVGPINELGPVPKCERV